MGDPEFPKNFVDANYCNCLSCGFIGIIHDLVGEFIPNKYSEKRDWFPRDPVEVRTEIKILPADEPKQLKLGWVVEEKLDYV